MRLSEAIRLGAMVHQQTTSRIIARDKEGNIVATCAIGAALVTTNVDVGWREAVEKMLIGCPDIVECPVCGDENYIFDIINLHIGCQHHWTREHIADWVESIEPKEVTANQEVSHDPAPVAVPACRGAA